MPWRYENYGTADSFCSGDYFVEFRRSRYGTIISAWGDNNRIIRNMPSAMEIWAKCDFYFSKFYSDGKRVAMSNTAADGTECGFWSNDKSACNCFLFVNENTSSREISGSSFAKSSSYTLFLHMFSNESNGIIEFYIDGNLKSSFSGNVNHGNPFDDFKIFAEFGIYVSNIIISDTEVGLHENVSFDRLGLRETPLIFSREKILAGYNLDEISRSFFRYNDAVKSLANILIDRFKTYEESLSPTVKNFSSLVMKLEAKYIQNPNLTDEENKLLEERQKFFAKTLQLRTDDVKNKILNVKRQIERAEQRVDEINFSENSLAELYSLRWENRADFVFVADNLLHEIQKVLDKVDFFTRNENFISQAVKWQEDWTDSYKTFKTSLREELIAVCREDAVDEEIFAAWYDDWQAKRFAIEQRFLPMVEFALKGNLLESIGRVLDILQSYREAVDKFYLHERKNIYQKFAFTAGGDLQEKFETESELYKLAEKLQRDLQEIIFSSGTEERIFLLRWSEPLLNIPIDEISNFIRDKELDAISEEVLTQFAALKRQNFAVYIADSKAYSDAVQTREKEFNALIFRMRKDLHKS